MPSGGGDKNPPYAFSMARTRVETWLTASIASFDSLSADAAPNDEVVGVLTLHPRYVSKSDFPRELLEATGLRAVGSRIERVRPDQWGIEKHPEEAYTEALYVAGSRNRFREWQAQLPRWSETHKGADTLAHVERFGAFEAPAKLRGLSEDVDREGVLEVVLHNSGDQRIVESFAAYVLQHGGEPLRKYRRDIRGLTFFPVRTSFARAEEIARYSFVRVARPMPVLRPSSPFLVRSMPTSPRQRFGRLVQSTRPLKQWYLMEACPSVSRRAVALGEIRNQPVLDRRFLNSKIMVLL